MKKGKDSHEEHEEEGNSERWLLTYSDMITLLLALFIVLYAISSADSAKYSKIATAFHSAFGMSDSAETGGGAGDGTGDGTGGSADISLTSDGSSQAASSSSAGTGNGAGAVSNPLTEIYTILKKYVNENNLQDEIELSNTDTYVLIRLKGMVMFVPDQAVMLETSKPMMQNISQAISQVYDRVDHITISGHTADLGETSFQSVDTSFELSENRAKTVRHSLMGFGVRPDKLSTEGRAHYEPVAPNDSEANRAQNRRVEITIYKAAPSASASASSTASSASASSAAGASSSASSTNP